MGDIVIFQSPTWLGVEFENQFLDKLQTYQCKIIVFIQDVIPLMFRENYDDWIQPYIKLYNRADVLILPSRQMEARLRQEGLTTEKIVYQGMWDHPTDYVPQVAQFARQVFFLGSVQRFPFSQEWRYQTPLELFAEEAIDNQDLNVHYHGYVQDELLLHQLSQGFGLCWSTGNQELYSQLNASYKLSTYLAAGIPVIVKKGISCEKIIQKQGLGYVVESLEEADRLVQKCTPEEYQVMAQRVHDYGFLIRQGYFTRRVFEEAIFKALEV